MHLPRSTIKTLFKSFDETAEAFIARNISNLVNSKTPFPYQFNSLRHPYFNQEPEWTHTKFMAKAGFEACGIHAKLLHMNAQTTKMDVKAV